MIEMNCSIIGADLFWVAFGSVFVLHSTVLFCNELSRQERNKQIWIRFSV